MGMADGREEKYLRPGAKSSARECSIGAMGGFEGKRWGRVW